MSLEAEIVLKVGLPSIPNPFIVLNELEFRLLVTATWPCVVFVMIVEPEVMSLPSVTNSILSNLSVIEELTEVNDPVISASIWLDWDTNVGLLRISLYSTPLSATRVVKSVATALSPTP